MQKPMQTTNELIAHMKNKGIMFNAMSESEASAYLDKNNYFKLSAYRKNYRKYINVDNKEVYEVLDFAYLVELARLDVHLRHILLGMCLDIEHALKVEIVKAIEKDASQDGYSIVKEYDKKTNILNAKIDKNKHNPYCGELIRKYQKNMPIWAFVEIISFGDLLRFGDFIEAENKWAFPLDRKTLDRVRQIRNACAHNNCILNNLCPISDTKSNRFKHKQPQYITQYLANLKVHKNVINKKMSNPRFSQIIHLLYVYKNIVKKGKTKEVRLQELQSFVYNRLKQNNAHFAKNKLLVTTYDLFKTVVDDIVKIS